MLLDVLGEISNFSERLKNNVKNFFKMFKKRKKWQE